MMKGNMSLLILGAGWRCPLTLLLLNIGLKVSQSNNTWEESQQYTDWLKSTKSNYFTLNNYADNPENFIYVENPKDYKNKAKHLLELKKEFSTVTGYKSNETCIGFICKK